MRGWQKDCYDDRVNGGACAYAWKDWDEHEYITTDSETVLVRMIVKLEMKNVHENITPSMMLVLFLSGRKEKMGIKLSMQ